LPYPFYRIKIKLRGFSAFLAVRVHLNEELELCWKGEAEKRDSVLDQYTFPNYLYGCYENCRDGNQEQDYYITEATLKFGNPER